MVDSHDPSDPDVIDPVEGDPLAFLYDAEDDEEADDSGDHPGYGSLLGVSPRGEVARKKAMAIVLDADEAQRAAEVMEINAGQLMTNPDRSHRNVGFLNLDPLEAMQEVEEEEALAESLSWGNEDEDEDDAGWQPENPLAGTGIEQEDEDDAEWQPVNPLAGTGIVQEEYEEAGDPDWAPENPLAETGFEQQVEEPDWQSESPPVGSGFEHPDEVPEWQPDDPLAGSGFEEAAGLPPVDGWQVQSPAPPDQPSAFAEEDDWIDAVPSAGQFAARKQLLAEEQAWTAEADAPAGDEPQFEEVEWDGPFVAGGDGENLPAGFEATVDEAPDEAGPVDLESARETAGNAPIEWQSLLARWVNEPPFAKARPGSGSDPVPIEAGGEEDADDRFDGFDPPEVPAMPDPVAGFATDAPEPEWRPSAADDADDDSFEAFDGDWRGLPEPEAPGHEFGLSEPLPEPDEPREIEILRFPAPPLREAPHHSLRAKVLSSSKQQSSRSEIAGKALVWLGARLKRLLPHLRRLVAWVREQLTRLANRLNRD